ncbi:exodeoxyribonuclease VII small subunit [Novipirellula caenicola]|uniref:Exodeoxyribonuclease 7 small subunit n=1 Tax=Novipirellula caenicola TaxID=1536901 RepID=A0ABP9VMC4_9BACT
MAKKKSTASDPASESDSAEIDFEQAVGEVQQIVSELESGELGLSESLSHYERGIKRLNQCHGLLEAAERKVTLLSGFDADGNPVTDPFEGADEKDSAPAKAGRRGRGTAKRKPDNDDEIGGLF